MIFPTHQIQLDQLSQFLSSIDCLFKIDTSGNAIDIIDRGLPHNTHGLPKGKMAVYIFEYEGTVLKVGKTGPNSNARFNSQHYSPNSSMSNLAKSLVHDPSIHVSCAQENISAWIKNNIRRIDILLDKDLGIFVLNLYEAALNLKYKPKYEGFKNQSC